MNRLKLLATATLMALAFTACDEGTPPPVEPPPPPTPVGTISGSVTIEGTAASGITATLSSGATTTTGSGGNFAFSGVEAGTYTVTISGFPEDATFAQVTQSATIATDGQNVQLNFAGEYIRSSAVVGNVVAADAMMSGGDGQPETLAGVTVTLGGEHAMGETMETGMDGGFAFTGLRAGTYTVTISDFPEDVSFETVSVEVEVEVGEVGNADFTGHFIRTSAVEGQVVIEGEGLAGVTVTLSGGPAEESYTMLTDADGMYRFEDLRPGDYTVSITDFDTRDYEFASTSQDVSVDLDETGTVSFTGVLLRTSGIAGRVSVEGMGLGGIEVSLAGGDETQTAMTDDGGQYSFAGLAAGDYTVSIAVESDAYVFESMSADVALADDESAIVNFEGAHARTASVSGTLFIDELDKNDMHDEGEEPFPSPGMLQALQGLDIALPPTLAVPITLVGPAVHEVRSGSLNVMTGQYSFGELRAGAYQLQVGSLASLLPALPPALAGVLQDFEYGGPGEGYAVSVAAGQAATQNIPIDITHTTITAGVTLKGGDYRGMPIPGASVELYSDADGETKVGSGMTGENGATMIRIARAGTSDNTVHMSVSTDDYFMAPGGGTQAVTWNPQSTMHPMAGATPPAVLNDADILNLNVDVSVSGATVTTDYGGGESLAGWAISVLSGDPTDPTSLMPVEGAPMMLGEEDEDDEGMASLKTAVMPTDLPASYVFALAPDQDDDLDGGENFAAQPVVHTHTGLMLAGTQDAGMLEVAFTTQTLKVYVHHERDQVEGFTGNVLGGDERDDGKVNVDIRYIDDSGRSRSFQASDSIDISSSKGAWTFSNVPADMNVIVQAEDGQDADDEDFVPIILLDMDGHSDELAAYTGTDTNGITGGHFGAMGGYSHTVSLCPLQATNPQDHDECSSFAYVSAHTVSGLIWKWSVEMDDADDFEVGEDPTFVEGLTVGLMPVEDKNIAGEEQSATTMEEDDDDTEDLDETHQFEFADIAAGAYMLDPPDGWRARVPADDDDLGDASPMGATGMVGDAFNPLGGDVSLDITPATATVYGFIVDEDGFAMDSATVTANNGEALTDEHGRFIIDGIKSETRTVSKKKVTGIFVEASVEGVGKASVTLDFAANTVTPVKKDGNDLQLTAAAETASVSGTVTASGSGDGIAGAKVEVSYDDGATFEAPENKNSKSKGATKNDQYVTDADGGYSVMVKAQARGEGVQIRVSKDGMSFVPDVIDDIPAHAGSAVSGFNFTGFVHAKITGRVVAAGGGPMSGVVVTATEAGAADGTAATAADTTGRTGSFSLSVPYDRYTIAAMAPETSLTRFGYPDDEQDIRVAPGQNVSFGNITGMSVNARSITATRSKTDGNYDGEVDISWRFDNVDGFASIAHQIQTCVEDCGEADATWTDAGFTADTDDDAEADGMRVGTFTAPASNEGDLSLSVRINVTATETLADATTESRAGTSDVRAVARVDASPSDIDARRQGEDATADSIVVDWEASTNSRTATRVVVTVELAGLGTQSLVAADASYSPFTVDGDADATSAVFVVNDGTTGFADATWTVVGTAQTVTVTEADLRKALSVRVETQQAAEVDDDGDAVWMATAEAEVEADPADDG